MNIKRKKGLGPSLVLAGFFLLLAGLAGIISYQLPRKSLAFDSSDAAAGDVVTLTVYDISLQPAMKGKDGSLVYIVQSKKDAATPQFVGIEVERDDQQIQQAIQQKRNQKLYQQPIRLVGRKVTPSLDQASSTSRESYISNYATITKNIQADSSIYRNFDSQSYLSLVDLQQELHFFQAGVYFSIMLAIACLVTGWHQSRQDQAAFDELCTAYPELEGQLDLLLEKANYLDEGIGLLIYQKHLISYHGRLAAQDLSQATQLTLQDQTNALLSSKYSNIWLEASYPHKSRPYKLPVNRYFDLTEIRVKKLCDYIQTRFPSIQIEI